MCIPPYVKYLSLAIVVGTLVILAVFYNRLFYFVPTFVFAVIWSRIKCNKCMTPILKDANGWYIFSMRSTCRNCGQDTLLCDVQPDNEKPKS